MVKMRKRLLMYALLFTSFVLAVKMADIIIRYDIGIFDYIKYSMPLSADEKRYLQKNVIKYEIDVNATQIGRASCRERV